MRDEKAPDYMEAFYQCFKPSDKNEQEKNLMRIVQLANTEPKRAN